MANHGYGASSTVSVIDAGTNTNSTDVHEGEGMGNDEGANRTNPLSTRDVRRCSRRAGSGAVLYAPVDQPPMDIDRCLCFNQRFADLQQVAEATGAQTVAELQTHVAFGQRCGLCRPYVRAMLRTGETVFHQILTDDTDG